MRNCIKITVVTENNSADSDLWKVIEKGASLTGKVTYSMEKRDSSGSDNPKYLDCSSFTAWAFHKAGFLNVPYASSTATFLGYSAFVDVSGELQPGDIGLKNREQGGGGINHVGIYCGALKDGTRVWLHCTSSSSTSLTGNESGVKQLIIKFYMEDSRDRSCYNKLKKQKTMSAFIKNLVLMLKVIRTKKWSRGWGLRSNGQ